MSEPIQSRPLRRSLMAAVVVILAFALLADRVYEYAVVFTRQVEQQYTEHLQAQGHALGRDFSVLLLAGDVESLRLAVSGRAANPLINRLLVTDDEGTVLASTQPGDEGQRIGSVLPFFNLLDFKEAQGRNRMVSRLGVDHASVAGYAPVQLPPKAGELRASRRGVMYMEYDLRPLKAANWSNLFSAESLLRWAATFLLAALLIHVLLRMQLFRPLEHLEAVTARFGKGDGEARSLLAGTGELATLGTVFNEMHDRLQAERARLAGQEALYRSITDHGHSLIWLSGPDGLIKYFNKPWLEFTGRSIAEEAGTGWTANLHPDDIGPIRHACAQANADRAFLSVLCRLRRHDGAFRWLLFEGTPRFGADGEFLGHVGHCLDITELKQAEEELQDERERLEITVTHRTHELAQARDAAQAASRAKTLFLANMSHEMRTPLNSIIGTTELVRGRLSDTHQREQLGRVAQASRHLLGIIDDVLDMARLETEQLRLCIDALSLQNVLASVKGMLEADLAAKGLQLHDATEPSLLARGFKGDERRLTQVLMEVLGNAIKFSDRGTVTVRATVEQETGSEALLRFDVTDEGIGIPPEDLPRLFAMFEQVDASSTRRHTGMGLGLALGKRLVALMGGDMGVESTPGEGSTFWFTVRLQTVDAPAEHAEMPIPAEPWIAPPPARASVGTGDGSSLEQVCEQLATLIAEWNFGAPALMSTHKELLSQGLGPHYHGIAEALAAYDFTTARERLAVARNSLGSRP